MGRSIEPPRRVLPNRRASGKRFAKDVLWRPEVWESGNWCTLFFSFFLASYWIGFTVHYKCTVITTVLIKCLSLSSLFSVFLFFCFVIENKSLALYKPVHATTVLIKKWVPLFLFSLVRFVFY